MIGSVNEVARWLMSHDDFAVITHIRPDGDAYGCALALTEALRALGKRAFPACDDPVEPKYRFLSGWDEFASAETLPFAPKAAVSVDVSEPSRMGKLAEIYGACESRAMIDHHGTNPGFGDACYVVEDAAAAGELVLDVIEALGVTLTDRMAAHIFTAVSTDSGNFSYRSTSANTYRAAAKCVEAGLDVEETTRALYRTRSLSKTKLLGCALNRIEMYAGGKIALIRLTNRMYAETGATRPESHGIVNYLNEIEGTLVGILAEELDDGVKFSFRAAGGTDVAALAQMFGGGGHVAAAGANVVGVSLDEIVPKVIEAATEHICRA